MAGGGPRGRFLIAGTAILWAIAIPAFYASASSTADARHLAGLWTARGGIAFFLVVFSARPLTEFWPGHATRWLRHHRRDLGLCFALTMAVHLVLVLAVPLIWPEGSAEAPDLVTLVGGGFAYALIAAMALTSFDRTTRALGPRAWNRLHRTGAWTVWFVFVQTTFGGLPDQPGVSILTTGLLLGAALLRLASFLRARRSR